MADRNLAFDKADRSRRGLTSTAREDSPPEVHAGTSGIAAGHGGRGVARGGDRVTVPLLLVDGHNLLWRAEYGFPARVTSRDGADRTAVFAFFALLRAAVTDLDRLVEVIVAFDGEHGAAHRQTGDPDYKANRAGIDLAPILALPDVKDGLDNLGVQWTELDGEEADDVIASVAHQHPDRHVLVMSTDRDYLQLIDDRVQVCNTARRKDRQLIGPADVVDRYRVQPRQWCDFRALTGDPADNIAGVAGVGDRTAARLLDGGLTLDQLPGSGRLTGAKGAAITAAWPLVLAWRDLIRVNPAIDLPLHLTATATPPLPTAARVLERLELW